MKTKTVVILFVLFLIFGAVDLYQRAQNLQLGKMVSDSQPLIEWSEANRALATE